jgi:hypothetical protein
MDEIRDLPLELFLYQMGGKLPTVDMDFGNPTPNSQLRAPLVNIEASSFDPSDILRMEQLGLQESNIRLNEARIKTEEAKAVQKEKQLEADIQKAEKEGFEAYLKELNKDLEAIEKTINPVTGLADLPGSRPIFDDITTKVKSFKDKYAEIAYLQASGAKISPDKYKEMQGLKESVDQAYNSPQFRKIFTAQKAYESFIKDVNKHKGGASGKIVIPAKVKEYREKMTGILVNPNSEISDINELTYDDVFFDEKDFLSTIDKGVKAFTTGNQDKITEFVNENPKVLRTNKTLVTDLSNPDKFVDTYVDYLKATPRGQAYIDHIGGEEQLRAEVINRASIINPMFGEKVIQDQGSTMVTMPGTSTARSGGGSGSGDGTFATKAQKATMIATRNQLLLDGKVARGDNGLNDERNPAFNYLAGISSATKSTTSGFNRDLSKEVEGTMNAADAEALKNSKGIENKKPKPKVKLSEKSKAL